MLRGVCGFLAVFTLFLLTLSLIFTFGGDAPSLFGRNIYIIKTDNIELLKPGTALFTSEVAPSEIVPGNLVIFKNAEGQMGVAEITFSEQLENIYSFRAVSERGIEIVLTQSQIVGKGMHFSNFFGGLIGFAKSPAGVLVIAVIPCLAILLYEGTKTIFKTLRGAEAEITPVRKQDETPTYIPRQKLSAAMSAYSKAEREDGFFSDDDEKPALDNFPLFTSPPPKPKPPEKPKPPPAPLSQKRLNEAIAEVNARKGSPRQEFPYDDDDGLLKTAPVEKHAKFNASGTAEIKVGSAATALQEAVKRYSPKKPQPPHVSQTAAIPRLDKILQEEDESENTRFNLEDILFSLDKKT